MATAVPLPINRPLQTIYQMLVPILKSDEIVNISSTTFRQDTPPGSRLDHTELIKELEETCVMAHHQCEAPTDTTEILTRLTWFTLPGFERGSGPSR